MLRRINNNDKNTKKRRGLTYNISKQRLMPYSVVRIDHVGHAITISEAWRLQNYRVGLRVRLNGRPRDHRS